MIMIVIMIQVLDNHSSKKPAFIEKKYDLLLREDEIEKESEKISQQPLKKHTFSACINIKFFDCAKCCGSQIVGCYSPQSGEHCERPLEIGRLCYITLHTFTCSFFQFSKNGCWEEKPQVFNKVC